jgi:hypothetical protein
MVDLHTMKVLSTYQVGEDPDVLAYDPGLRSLYVSAKSGAVTIFQSMARALLYSAPWRSCTYGIGRSKDPSRLLPLENIDGYPVLRIMQSVD